MEDKRTALALFLCIVFIMVYSEAFISPLTRRATPPPAATSTQQATTDQNATPRALDGTAPKAGQPAQASFAEIEAAKKVTAADIAAAGEINVQSDNVSLRISKLGGRLTHYNLRNYKHHMGADTPVDMVRVPADGPYPLGVFLNSSLSDENTLYMATIIDGPTPDENGNVNIPSGGKLKLNLRGTLPNGVAVEKVITLKSNSYMLDVEVRLGQAVNGPLWLVWTQLIPDALVHDKLDPPQYTALISSTNKIQHYLLPSVVEDPDAPVRGRKTPLDATWLSLADKYFTATLIPYQDGPNAKVLIEDSIFMTMAQGGDTEGKFTLYIGPKDYSILKDAGYGLERNVDLGIFSFLAFPLVSLLRFFERIFGNYGLAIILLTLLIKTLFLPLTKASMKSMQAMQDIQPEVKALRERIKDATQLNQEMMALYKRKGVNPMGGCLPILIQIPVFLGLYNALLYSIELRHAPFALWINDLSSPESLMVAGIPVPVMILLMGASMFVQQWTSPQPSADPTQKKIMMMMPIIFTIMFVIFPFPSGLVLYWLVNNIISIVQQVYLRSHRKASPLAATLVGSAAIFLFGYLLTLLS